MLKDNQVIINIPLYELPNVHETLFKLCHIICKWKGVVAKFKEKKISLYHFVFLQYSKVNSCGEKNIKSDNPEFCNENYGVQTWGCKHLDSIKLNNSGNGNYKKSNLYWYNFGAFDNLGIWHIDKEAVFSLLEKEASDSAYILCPFFDLDKLHRIVFEHLPSFIIPDNYNYRLHYEAVKENGREILRAVNIRHIESLETAPGLLNKRMLFDIHSAYEMLKVLPPDIPAGLKRLFLKEAINVENEQQKPFDKDGLCKN